MPSYFILRVDRTAPAGVALNVNAGATYTTSQSVTAQPTTSDGTTTGYEMKLWGNVDTADNPDIQATEGASNWITFVPSQPVRLSSGDGTKTLSVRIRDEVDNQSAPASHSITLDTTVPVLTISVAAFPNKISKVLGYDTTAFQFRADSVLQAWKIKVVPATNSLENVGVTIGTSNGSVSTTGGSLAALTNKAVTIKGADLEVASAGDGPKVVKVFGQDLSGLWSL